MNMSYILAAIIMGYLLGSIPFGLLITRITGLGDVRKIGSGNIGATNVLRTGRKDLAFLTLLLDAAKAASALLIAQYYLGTPYHLIAGAAALIGHCYPVWLGFKGGKGVAAFFGILLAAHWPLGLIAMALWLFMALIFKMSSLAALTTALAVPFIGLLMLQKSIAMMAAVLCLIIFIRHKDNIRRILSGKEARIGGKNKQAGPS